MNNNKLQGQSIAMSQKYEDTKMSHLILSLHTLLHHGAHDSVILYDFKGVYKALAFCFNYFLFYFTIKVY